MIILNKLLTILFLVSCANAPKVKKNSDEIVNINDLYNKKHIEIEKEVPTDYGPSIIVDKEYEDANTVESKLFAIDLYPALYKSFGYISLFKELEAKSLKPAVVSTFGFSSIMAALYCKHLKANIVEWKSYSLFQDIKDIEPHSKEWYEKIEDFLDKEFGKSKLSQLKILLLIPRLTQTGTIKINPTREVAKAIYKSIKSEELVGLSKTINKAPVIFKGYGVDRFFRVSLLPS
jgi:hypothetical protein